MEKIIAHRMECENEYVDQLLVDHLLKVGELSKETSTTIGLGWTSYLIGVYHDLGKGGDFQSYIRSEGPGVNHSTAGAYFLFNKAKLYLSKNNISGDFLYEYLNLLILPILMHHGLMDIVNLNLPKEINNTKCYLYSYFRLRQTNSEEDDAAVLEYGSSLSKKLLRPLEEILLSSFEEWCKCRDKIKNLVEKNSNSNVAKKTTAYYNACLVRLLLSVLKEADIYDSSNFFRENLDPRLSKHETARIWERTVDEIEKKAVSFETTRNLTPLNRVRCNLSEQCKEAAFKKSKGVYTLELPTGAGKTISVLRYALNHAVRYDKKRVLYTTAFLSVLEQNAAEIKDIIGEKCVLEHHSNIVDDLTTGQDFYDNKYETKDDESQIGARQYLIESWESPVILTTLVQLTNTLFGGRASQLRRFSKLIDSVIIMDEVQSLPLKAIYNMNLMTNFLSEIMGATIVHCTATTPVYENKEIEYPIHYATLDDGESSLAKIQDDTKLFRRVEYVSLLGEKASEKLSIEQLTNHVTDEMKEADSCLIICNKKSDVLSLYSGLKQKSNAKIIYLTTNLCAAHRLDLIKQMDILLKKNREDEGEKLICISTKLIEAGVDLDFDLVYRAAAGLDSLIQSAGRCNREGKRIIGGVKVKGKCFSFKLFEEDLSRLPEIAEAQNAFLYAMRQVQENDGNFNPNEIKDIYFNQYYKANKELMKYPLIKKNTNILECLSENKELMLDFSTKLTSIDRCRYNSQRKVFSFNQNFKMASEAFHLIDDKATQSIIVPYKNEELLEAFYDAEASKDIKRIKRLLKKSSRYTVQVSNMDVENKSEAFIPISILEVKLLILNNNYYDDEIGLNFKTRESEVLIC